jgi:hypothetical protein
VRESRRSAAQLFVADSDALACGFRERRLFVDHLLQDLLVDAELRSSCS